MDLLILTRWKWNWPSILTKSTNSSRTTSSMCITPTIKILLALRALCATHQSTIHTISRMQWECHLKRKKIMTKRECLSQKDLILSIVEPTICFTTSTENLLLLECSIFSTLYSCLVSSCIIKSTNPWIWEGSVCWEKLSGLDRWRRKEEASLTTGSRITL